MPSRVRLPGCQCLPYMPAGLAWYHSDFCTLRRNQKLNEVELHSWQRAKDARDEAIAQANASAHPTAPDEPWWITHDRLAVVGECPDPVCFRCDRLDDSGPYDEQVVV